MNRLLLVCLATLLLLAAPLAVLAELSPFFDAQTMLPTDQIRRGMKGVLKTVYQGTTISEDQVEIVGVVQKFNLGEDIILGKMLSGPVREKNIGVIAGMSGSPVYVDGKLIGALAFSWPFMTEPIFGITSINSMLRAWDRAAGAQRQQEDSQIAYGARLAGRNITRAEVSWNPTGPFVDEHTIALRPAAPLLYCSGLSPRAMRGLTRFFEPYGLSPLAGPGTVQDPADTQLEPGSAVGVRLLWGDFDISGVGTVTYTQGPRVLAFGHQMLNLGGINFPLTTAWVHDILPNLEISTKMGSPMKTVGALRQDTPWAIGGEVGQESPSVSVQVSVTDADSGLHHNYRFWAASHESLTPMLVLMGLMSSSQAAYSAGAHGMVESSIVVEGTKGARATRANTSYFEDEPFYPIAMGVMEAAALFRYNLWEPQDLASVRVEATMRNADQTAVIERVYSEQAVAKAGQPLNLHVVIRPWGAAPVDERITLDLPADLPAVNLQVGVCGGELTPSLRSALGVLSPNYDSLEGILSEFSTQERNTDLVVMAARPDQGMSVGAVRLPRLPQSVQSLLGAATPMYLSQGAEELSAKRAMAWHLFGGELLTVPVEDRQGNRPQEPSSGGDKPVAPDEEEGEGDEAPAPGGPGERGAAWFTAPVRKTDLTLPEYPPRTLGWAASGLRPDIAARMRPRPLPLQASPVTPPSSEKPQVSSGASEGTGAAARPARERTKTETPAPAPETKDEEGVGLVLRQPSSFTHATADDFAEGYTRGTGLASEGGIILMPTWTQAALLPPRTLLAAVCGSDGALYYSTDGGRVYRLQGDQPELFCDTGEFAATALAMRPDGGLLAGCSPSGRVLRINPEGKASLLGETGAMYIWSLLPGPDGTVYAGTGPGGVVYKISPEGACTPWLSLPVNHVLQLAWRGEDLVAATAQGGGVYVLSPTGTARLLYAAADNDVTSLVVDAAGYLYAGTDPGGQVVRIDRAGHTETVYEDSDTPVGSLLATADGVYVGTSPEGRIYLVRDGKQTASVHGDSAPGLISRLVLGPDGRAYALSNGPGSILTCSLAAPREGTYVSTPQDAERLAAWGKVTWDAVGPEQAVTVQCRSGNSATPEDGTWGSWSAPLAAGALLPLPPTRFMQYRLRLQAPADQPVQVRRITISYLPANQAPELELSAPEAGAALRGKYTISWSPSDPDDDALLTTIYRRTPGGPWEKLTGPTKDEEYEWDTTTLEAGRYDLRLVVSDARSNPTGALEDELIVTGLVIDNDAPTLLAELGLGAAGEAGDVGGAAVDAGSGVVAVSWKDAADTKGANAEWHAAQVTPLPFGASLLSFVVPRAQIPEGVRSIVVRAIDAAGNYTDVTVELVEQERPLDGEHPGAVG